MKTLKVIAPVDQVKALRALAKVQCMSIYQDGAYLKLKWGSCEPVLEAAAATLPEGSFEVYHSTFSGSFGREAYRSSTPDAVRIKVR